MADISYFQNADLEESSDGMDDDYGKNDDQQGDSGGPGEKDGGPELTPLDRLFQHSVSPKSVERQMVGKLLTNIFQNAVKSKTPLNIDEVFQPVENILYDPECAVRSSLVECLPHVALICQEAPYLFGDNLTNCILDIILLFIRDQDNQVRQDAQAALRMLLERELLDDEQIVGNVCNVIVDLSRDECQEFQTIALTLMTKVNPYIGDELTEKLFLDRFLELCLSEGLFVRRVCASIMGEFCTIMSNDTIYNKLLPTYANLCLDSVWGVRKTSVDVMMSVARYVPLYMRRLLLSKLLVQHLSDESRWVRRSAYEILGPFIATFARQFHELICDQKGELVLVHENERGWPRFNVVPVAKVSDILTENLANRLSISDDFYWKPQNISPTIKRRRFNKETEMGHEFASFMSRRHELNKFNLFQYYYDPPDMPLDPKLVESIINDNDTTTDNQTNENKTNKEDSENENVSDKKSDRQQDSNTNVENKNEQKQQCSNEKQEHEVKLKRKSSEKGREDDNEEDDDEEEKNDNGENTFEYSSSPETKMQANFSVSDVTVDFNSTYDLNNASMERRLSFDVSNRLSNLSFSNLNNAEDDEEPDEIVPRILVDHFVSMAEPQPMPTDLGQDLDYHCAFSFPAVVLTLGKENWHRLKEAYQHLASAVPWKVRSTLASSIHEIAIIIEKEYAARDLVPIFNGFIKDLDEVKIGALKHFSTFLKVLNPQDRMQYLPKLNDFLTTDNKWNWRLREELVKQLSEIIHLYQRNDVAQYIAPLLLHLMQDRVAAVRHESLDAVAKTIELLAGPNDEPLAIIVIQEMRDLLMANAAERWIIRQTYALICSKLISKSIVSSEVLVRELLPYLLELSYDQVPNVRLVVARTLADDIYNRNPHFFEKEVMSEIKQKLQIMQSDCDRDVRIFASGVNED